MYVVKMDEEGRITIPQEIISAQGFGKDTAFLVANMNDTLILKKVIEKGAQTREEPVQEKEEKTMRQKGSDFAVGLFNALKGLIEISEDYDIPGVEITPIEKKEDARTQTEAAEIPIV